MANIVFIWFFGFFISIFIGHYVTRYINQGLRCYIRVELGNNKLTPSLGCIERTIYTLLFYFAKYEFIAALFGIMVAQRLIAITVFNKKEEFRKKSKEKPNIFKEVGERINVYFISNFVSLFFGILGGVIIKFLK